MAETVWWQQGIIYQVYPRSFQDSDGNGVGDLQGIIERMDYFVWLGVDALWISPIYPSPMADFGYDITNYCDIDPLFGTLQEFDCIVSGAHRRSLKIILDFVPNHTSEQHPWFDESRSSRSSAKRDWYIWRDARPDGGPPTNWCGNFGGSAWEWDDATGQYYYHSFLREQPDLNWRNHDVRNAMYDVLRFWLDRGVDGFRVDVLWMLIKDDQLRDNPGNPAFRQGSATQNRLIPLYNVDRPEVHGVVAEMRHVLDAYGDRVLIGEIYLPIDRLVSYYGDALQGAHLPFNFQLLSASWNAPDIARIISDYETALPVGAWPNWVLGNHDISRVASRVGAAQARVAGMLLLTLRGTPTIYYGEELGLEDVPMTPESVQDPYERKQPGLGLGRDPERTPMPWDSSVRAGFTSGTPWLPLAADHEERNVQVQTHDPQSILALYRRLIELRRQHQALRIGVLEAVAAEGHVLLYQRTDGIERLAVVLNMGHEPCRLACPNLPSRAQILLSTLLDRCNEGVGPTISLRADEGLILAFEIPGDGHSDSPLSADDIISRS